MEKVDRDLAAEQVPPHQRQFKAYFAMSPDYQGPLLGAGVDPTQYPDFVGPNLLKRIGDWYKERYGTRACVPWVIGRVPVLIRGQVFVFRIPLVFGHYRFNEEKVLDLVEGMTDHLASSLTPPERQDLLQAFFAGYVFIYEIEDIKTLWLDNPKRILPDAVAGLLERAIDDYEDAVQALTERFPNTHNACFHAQQSAEKMLKAYLVSKGIRSAEELARPPFGHKLDNVFGECVKTDAAFSQVSADVELLRNVEMKVRYTDDKVNVHAAVDLVWASLRIAGLAACRMIGRPRRYEWMHNMRAQN